MLHKANQELNKRSMFWSLGSFAILGMSGVLLNIIIGLFYTPEALGVFNQVFAIYIVFSQLGIMGLHNSLQKHVTEYLSLGLKLEGIISSALTIIFLTASISTLFYFFSAPLAAQVLRSPAVQDGMKYSALGLLLFCFNKSFLNLLNAASQIALFSVGNMVRSVSLIGGIIILSLNGVRPEQLCLSLTISEALVSLYCVISLIKIQTPLLQQISMRWLKVHFDFGIRSILSGFLVEFNTRVDILILGIYLSDSQVGIYSFAALIAEGVAQLPTAFRANYNPQITSLWAQKKKQELLNLINKTIRKTRLYLALPIGLSIAIFPFVPAILKLPADYQQGWMSYSILVSGILFSSGYLVIFNLFLLTGFPGLHSFILLMICSVNALMNWLLVPYLGLEGAALGTAISSICIVTIFKFYIAKIILPLQS